MVAAFLGAEIESSRFGGDLRAALSARRLEVSLIREPDLDDPSQNAKRSAVLGDFRGWKRDKFLFHRWPSEVEWSLVELTRDDATNLRYLNAPEWKSLSRDSFKVTIGANRVKGNDPSIEGAVPIGAIKSIARHLRSGGSVTPLICVQAIDDSRITVIEGHSRMTAWVMTGARLGLPSLLGISSLDSLHRWQWFPPEVD